jgi:hypothetical protein
MTGGEIPEAVTSIFTFIPLFVFLPFGVDTLNGFFIYTKKINSYNYKVAGIFTIPHLSL